MLAEAVEEAMTCGLFPRKQVPGAALRALLTEHGMKGVKAPQAEAAASASAAAAPLPLREQICEQLVASLADASVIGDAAVAKAKDAAAACEGATDADRAWAFTTACLKVSKSVEIPPCFFVARRCWHAVELDGGRLRDPGDDCT
jgi:hypothetical protein